MSLFGRRIRRGRDASFEIRLPGAERQLLRALVDELRATLTGDRAAADDPDLRRLFPTAYPDDPDRDQEYRSLVHDDLLARRLAALDTVETTIDANRLDEEELLAWMGFVNDVRLVLGTRLDVSEDMDARPDPDDPNAPALAVYGYLGVLLESMVDALSR